MADKNEHSEELRALALRFFAFTDEYQAERTKKYMELSLTLKDQIEKMEEMLAIMVGVKPFPKIPGPESTYYGSPKDVATETRTALNKFSSNVLFSDIRNRAKAQANWASKKTNQVPNAEAAAWLAYFTEYCRESGEYIANDNWHNYYKDFFASQPTRKKARRKKAKGA